MNPLIVSSTIFGHTFEIHLFGLLSAIVSSTIYPIYIASMVSGKETPPRSTWFMWLVLDVIAFMSRWDGGIFDTQLVAYITGTSFTFLFTLKYGKKGWSKDETYCSLFVVGSIIVWTISPSLATVCAISGLTVATWPLFKVLLKGGYSNRTTWSLATVGSLFNIADGQLLTGIWFSGIQIALLTSVVYHWGWTRTPEKN